MPLQRHVAAAVLLLAVAACAAPASAPSSPGSSSPGIASSSPSALASPGASGSASGPAESPPDLVDAPPWVRNREPLPFCGVELQPGTMNADARRCFVAAAAAGQPAEMLVRATTIEGGTVQYLYRTTPGNPFEQIIDGTGDQFGSGRWERQVCIRLTRGDPVVEDPTGRLNFGFESCEDATPPL